MSASPTRRRVLGVLGAGLAAGVGRARADEGLPRTLTVIVAGPAGGGLVDASQMLLAGLGSHLPPGTLLQRDAIGGVDGVTGANQFTAQAAADGTAALLLPGAASIAWMVGDSRVHFDPSRWLPVLAQLRPTLVVASRRVGTLRPGLRLRVASGGPDSPALAAMLGLELLGASVSPAYQLGDDAAALAALADGRADAALLRTPDAIAALDPAQVVPLFSFGVVDGMGATTREAALPAAPTLLEVAAGMGHAPAGPAYAAWRCAGSAAQLRFALVLPSLTPPAAVALWREAGQQAGQQAPGADGTAVPVVYAAAAAGLMQSLAPDGTALLDVRAWMARRLGWQAS